MRRRLKVAGLIAAGALALAGSAQAGIVDVDGSTVAPGGIASVNLTANNEESTAFAVGFGTLPTGTTAVVDWATNCTLAVNDRAGQIFLGPYIGGAGPHAIVWTSASATAGFPFPRWDLCDVNVTVTVDFPNPVTTTTRATQGDPVFPDAHLTAWLASHDGT